MADYRVPLGERASQRSESGGRISGGIWIELLRILAWVQFFVIIVVCFFLASKLESAGLGLLVCIVSPLFSASSVAVTMVLLDAARDIKTIAENSPAKNNGGRSDTDDSLRK